jgi:uncharacterized spore protein YtfJ
MDVQEFTAQARDALTVKRVFGEPYEKDGLTIIPAARVQGAAGAGGGEDPQGQGKGSGGGFGMTARPVGAFIIREGELTWRPAVDATRIAIGGQVVAIVALLTARTMFKAWVKARG